MELRLEVVLSSSIKRKKPWPRFCWLGQERESVFLLDDKRISEINMVSGRTKKRTPKLHHLLKSVVTMTSSHNGLWLCGLLFTGELFLWNKDKDLLKTTASVPEIAQIITSAQGNPLTVSVQVSLDGMRVLLLTKTAQAFLWECLDEKDLTGLRDGPVKGRWAHICSPENITLPSSQDKEASQHTLFVRTEEIGDACLSAFVFTSGTKLIITFLKIQWEEGRVSDGSVGYDIQWTTKTYPMSGLIPPCQPVKSRGALLPAFSPDGKLIAVVLNQRRPKATQVLFVSTQNFVTLSRDLGGCGSKNMDIPSKYIRSYWVGSVSWSPGGLFLTCVLKRGSLLMLARLGGLLTLSTSGCNVDFGPAHFLPLHPLVTYRPPRSAGNADASLSSSSVSVRDIMRQRYSVTWHPQLMYLIISDGYLATVTRVLDRPSPGLLLKALLKDVKADLEKASQRLEKFQIHAKAWLESVSSLNLDGSLEQFNSTLAAGRNTVDSGSTLPLFLQDQGTLGATRELFESVQAFFEDDSDVDGLPPGSHAEDGGRLEFASMFDTLHAVDTHSESAAVTSPDYGRDSVETGKKSLLQRDLKKIQSRLLTAWAFGMSLGNAVEHRSRLLKHAMCCLVRFAALLHLSSTGDNNTSSRLLHLIRTILSFLPWDGGPSEGPRCLGLMVEFSKHLIRLLLTPNPDSSRCNLSSQSLSEALLVVQLISDSLDDTYNLERKARWSCAEREPPSETSQLWFSDVFLVPLLQDSEKKSSFVRSSLPVPQRPSSRLLGAYQMMYNVTKQYMQELKNFTGFDGCEEEEQQVTVIMSQIQTALQATGEKLEGSPALLSHPGEDLFLCGSYAKSAQMWQLQICEEHHKRGDRTVYQETRLCLALLYSLLWQYQLKDAQELGDHMAQLVLHRAGCQKDSLTADSLPCSWVPADLHPDAAFAVVQTLGRLMASYFTNQPLHILPPHHVAVLPPLHLPHEPTFGRLVPLCQEEVSRAVRQQHLSQVWTVDYAQDLLLIGGLLPEAAWLASNLGDWKTAVSLSLAYTSYCNDHSNLSCLRRRELRLPSSLKPEIIFQTELESLLCTEADSAKEDDGSLTDLLDGEDWDLLRVSLQEILKASVIAGVNVMSSPLSSLLDSAKEVCSSLPALVPTGLYLPSPPLYCPQPSPNTQDQMGALGHLAEVTRRHKVSGILQRLLLLLRSGRCCHPAAQWYICHLRRARHLLHKIKKKYPYPSVPEAEKTFPEGLTKLDTRSGHFRRGPNRDENLDADATQIISCFRELCALCWMLHVRDQLSVSCRRYHGARQRRRDEDISGDADVNSACSEALRWACRFLPFSRFLNAEEILQDVLLSLVSELPPVSLVADTLVQAFPDEEESVRVPLREKYNSLMQRLRQCNVLEEEKEEESELMMLLIRDKFRQRKKHLGRLQRHIAPTALHLWEKEDEEEDGGSKHGMAMLRQLSLGTSLSTSSLADCRLPPVCSDGDTAENTSEAVSPGEQGGAKARRKGASKAKKKKLAKKSSVKTSSVKKKEVRGDSKENEQPSLPVVGTWEFELEDDEYLIFLELFLSYVLEKDIEDGGDPTIEPPLLSGFCSEIRERELHSLTFDVLTTIRRQRDGLHPARRHLGNDPPVFRAGSSYRSAGQGQGRTPELRSTSICSNDPMSRISLSVTSQPGWRTGTQTGLFGLKRQSSVPSNRGSETIHSAFITEQPSDGAVRGSSAIVAAVTDLQQGLDPKLEAQFPKLGRLLEWMVRWADRRVLLGRRTKKRKEKGAESVGTADEGVVIRVKASVPAILTSLSLLERRYAASLGTDRVQVPRVERVVSPALQPPERESSVDTGYPGSVNTPVNVADHRVQQEEESIASLSSAPEEVTLLKTPFQIDQDLSIGDMKPRQSDLLDDRDETTEKEDADICSEALDASSSCSSENVCRSVCTPDMSLKLADLECSVQDEDMSSSFSHHSPAGNLHSPPHEEVPASPTDEPKAAVPTEISDFPEMRLPNSAAKPASDQACTSTPAASHVDFEVPNQRSSTETPPVRHHLGEDLFRLIQHINYMSLRDVLQASYSNVQNSTLAQSNVIASLHEVPSLIPANSIPEPPAPHIQPAVSGTPQTQKYVPTSASNKPHVGQTSDGVPPRQPATQSSVQELQPLSVQAGSPESPLRGSRKLIPFSEGLLATTDSNHTFQSASAASPSSCSSQNEPPPHTAGLKLLQLHRPPSPQHSVPPCASTHAAKPISHKKVGLKRHTTFITSHDPTPRSSRNMFRPPERSTSQELSLLTMPPMLPPHTAAPSQGLRLLSFQAAPHDNFNFPKLVFQSTPRPSPVITVPLTESPVLKLLRIDHGPKIILPQPTPSVQTTHLMSVDEVTKSVIRRQNAEETRLQLLRVEPSDKSTTETTPLSSLNSRKRHKRREEKTRKAEVRFKPNDSIIPTQEPTEPPETEQPACSEEIPSGEDISIPQGSADSFPTGQTLLDEEAMFASVKRAFGCARSPEYSRSPERYDAFTNTELSSPPMFEDKSVATQFAVLVDNGNFVQDNLYELEGVQDLGGRKFLNILDLEDTGYHQNSQPHLRPEAPEATSIRTSSLPPAQRILSERSAPPPDLALDDIPRFDIFRAVRTQNTEPHRTLPPSDPIWLSNRISDLDAQLASVQILADHLESNLSNCNVLVNNMENLVPGEDPDVKTTTATAAAKKTVRLSVPPKAAWAPKPEPEPQIGINVIDENDENEEEEEEEYQIYSCDPAGNSSIFSTSLRSQAADPASLQTSPSRMDDPFTETDDITEAWADEDLGQSELSETAVILDELVKEGYLSPTTLDLTSLRTPRHTRLPDQPYSSRTAQDVEDERREVRIWMRRKQKEKMAALKRQREREQQSFPSSTAMQSTNRSQASSLRNREEDKKVTLLEQYLQRTNDACALVDEVLTCPIPRERRWRTDRSYGAATPRYGSAPSASSTPRIYRTPVDEKRSPRFKSEHARPHSWRQSTPEDYRTRLGLHRPVTVLPKDRLSQVTRRGMLAGTRSQSERFPAGQRRRTELNKTFTRGTPVYGGTPREQMRRGGRDEDDTGFHSPVLAGDSKGNVRGNSSMEWLDEFSDSESRTLSRKDWAAIERIMAAEEG
ncbi:unnamed protein product [Ophioblennius macclurei]